MDAAKKYLAALSAHPHRDACHVELADDMDTWCVKHGDDILIRCHGLDAAREANELLMGLVTEFGREKERDKEAIRICGAQYEELWASRLRDIAESKAVELKLNEARLRHIEELAALREELAQVRADREIKVANLTEERDAYKASSDIRGENIEKLRGDITVILAGVKAGLSYEEIVKMASIPSESSECSGITDTQRLDWLEKRGASLCFNTTEDAAESPDVIEAGWAVCLGFKPPYAEPEHHVSDASPSIREVIDRTILVIEDMEKGGAS